MKTEPVGSDAPDVARQLLQPFGLGLKIVAPGIFAVIQLDAPAPAPQAAPPGTKAPAPLLEQVIVAASRYTLAPDEAGATRLDSGTLAAQPQYAETHCESRRTAGCDQQRRVGAWNIRGSDADELLLLVDGFPVRQAFHLPALQSPFSAVESSVIANLDVYTVVFRFVTASAWVASSIWPRWIRA